MIKLNDINVPTLLLDEARCRRNISMMVDKAKANGIVLRPHFKTHQSLEIGRWFRSEGIEKITVSSVKMAEYFSADWSDITIAFPVNIREINAINGLASRITLNLLIESVETAKYLNEHLTNPANFFLKIDIGYHRTGINPQNKDLIDHVLSLTDNSSSPLNFIGFLGHAGHSYKCQSLKEIRSIHTESTNLLVTLKQQYGNRYPQLLISTGDTPTCSVVDDFSMVDEIRPGNFVFYDLTQHHIGSNRMDQIAVAMVCPVVAIHKDRYELVVYGGGVHFSKDRIALSDGESLWGQVVEHTSHEWGEPIPGMTVKSLSQEHGIVKVPEHLIHLYEIGDLLVILPIHSCMTADLMKSYLTLDGLVIDRL